MCDQEEEYFSSEEEESEEEDDDDDEWRKTPMFQRIKKAGHVSFSDAVPTYLQSIEAAFFLGIPEIIAMLIYNYFIWEMCVRCAPKLNYLGLGYLFAQKL